MTGPRDFIEHVAGAHFSQRILKESFSTLIIRTCPARTQPHVFRPIQITSNSNDGKEYTCAAKEYTSSQI